MSKLAIVVCLWIALGLDMAMRASFAAGNGASYSPSMTLALIAAIAAFAPLLQALSVAFVAGVLLDLTQTHSLTADAAARFGTGTEITIIGPHALGCLAGAFAVVRCRAFLLRSNPLSMVAFAMLCALATHAVALLLLGLRGVMDSSIAGGVSGEMGPRMLSALLTGVPGLVLGLTWRWLLPVLGLSDPFSRQSYYGGSGGRGMQ